MLVTPAFRSPPTLPILHRPSRKPPRAIAGTECRAYRDNWCQRSGPLDQLRTMEIMWPNLADPLVLTSGPIELRPWSLADLGCVAEAATDPRMPAGTTVPAVYSPEAGAG
jgi:hypothetical protein